MTAAEAISFAQAIVEYCAIFGGVFIAAIFVYLYMSD